LPRRQGGATHGFIFGRDQQQQAAWRKRLEVVDESEQH
jgi:hypothetical protein